MALLLVRYREDFGRAGDLDETFVTTPLELRAFKAIGEVWRGAVLGKHSDIVSTLDGATLRIICRDQDWIERGVKMRALSGPSFRGTIRDILRDDRADGTTRRWDALRAGLSAKAFREVCELWGLGE